jgi:endonuclease/exonuclease/phosphatase (EEP) superfamily protein YafD
VSGWRRWAGRLLAAVAIVLIVGSFLPAWQTDHWWVREWDYPRLQVAGLLILFGVALWLVDRGRSRVLGAIVVGCAAALAWQLVHFVAYLPPYPPQVASTKRCAPGRQLSLLNANVLMSNNHYDRLLGLVDRMNPDVILLLEADRAWEGAVAGLAKRYPFRLSEAIPNTYGMILMSRLPMEGRIEHRLQPGVPSANVRLQLRDGQEIILHALHPEPPWPGDDSGERDAELVSVGREVRGDGRAAIVMGDLNDVAWSRTSRLFKKVAGVGDPRVGRGFYPTFNAKWPLLRWPLDHLFVSPHFQLMAIDRLGDIGSDHFPIAFRLCLTEEAGKRLVTAVAPPGTEAEASDELRDGRAEKREENAR